MARKAKKPIETSSKFVKAIRSWQKLEDDTIKYADNTMKKSKNPLIKMTMEMIKSDSQKHKVMQQMLIDSVSKEKVHLSIEELAELSEGLNRHMAAEAKSLEFADDALSNCELFETRYILSMLIADETKHHKILGDLNELKRRTILVT
jgi:rubrerythrin